MFNKHVALQSRLLSCLKEQQGPFYWLQSLIRRGGGWGGGLTPHITHANITNAHFFRLVQYKRLTATTGDVRIWWTVGFNCAVESWSPDHTHLLGNLIEKTSKIHWRSLVS